MKKQVEMSIQDENGNEFVAYPKTYKDHVQFDNGMTIDEYLEQDVAMPTVTHEESSIKVGVGDSDVSNSIVDGTIGKMVIKGQTYQNILPEPSLRNKMIGKSTQRLNEGYDNIEVVDGVSKSAILKGNTLVNIFDVALPTEIKNNHDITLSYQVNANETYTFIVEAESTSEKYQGGFITANGGGNGWNGSVDNGISKFTVTTSEATNKVRFSALGASNTVQIKKCMIIKGDYSNQDIPFFTGMQSVKMPVLKTVGKNLFNTNSFTGEFYPNNSYITVDFPPSDNNTFSLAYKRSSGTTTSYVEFEVRVLPNKKYFFSYNKTSLNNDPNLSRHFSRYAFVINNTKESLKYVKFSKKNGGLITTPSNCTSLMIRMYTTQGSCLTAGDTITLSEIQLEEVTEGVEEASPFEPYKTNILSCQLAPLNQSMFEQGSFSESTPANTQPYENIKLNSGSFYNNRIRTKGTYKVVKGATYSGQLNNGYGIFICYCKNGLYSAKDKGWIDETNFTFTVPNDCDEMFFALKKTDNSAITPSDYSRIGLKIHQEVVLRSLPNGVKDTLNLMTGEYVKRIVEIVLDGSETWNQEGQRYWTPLGGHIVGNTGKTDDNVLPNKYVFVPVGVLSGTDITIGQCRWGADQNFMVNQDNGSMGVASWKTYLSQNPLTIQCQLATPIVKTVDLSIVDQDDNTQENLNFFANGHIQVSSGENSLLPFVQYEIPTKNSYHMDLMKTNTKYTMKAKSASGTFTIDGTSYRAGTNGTFTTPTSMTNKLLVMSNKTNEEVMIIGGDVVSKTIPYFKGIKSAFEGEDKIEVLSTGKNLFDISKWSSHHNDGHGYFSISGDAITVVSERDDCYTDTGVTTSGVLFEKYRNMTFSCKPNTTYTCSFTMNLNNPSSSYITFFDKYYNTLSFHGFKTSGSNIVSPNGAKYFTLRVGVHSANGKTVVFSDIQVVEGSKKEEYQSHKSNSTKIPLLSPLRSLPNGVSDELIIDRLNHKAKLIQRIGEVILDGSDDESWTTNSASSEPSLGLQGFIASQNDYQSLTPNRKQYGVAICDTLPTVASVGREGLFNGLGINIITSRYSFTREHKEWLSKNPTTVLYELKTPIITEIDLEGYPYVYKDGHIFLNSEIAPTTEITYSINQAQQIESANENLQRHEKEISHLQKLIAQYIQVEYESTLLSLKI